MSLLALIAAHAAGTPDPDLPYDPGEDTTPYAFPTSVPYNVPVPAITPTYDNSGQGIHPSVVDFQTQHGIPAWNGYRFWMGMTPYTGSAIAVENPSILASHDGFTWHVPAGLTNPLEYPADAYLSDTELVYDSGAGRLVLFWRQASTPEQIRAAWSTNGTAWTIVGTIVEAAPSDGKVAALSPTVVRDGPNAWRMVTIGYQGQPSQLRTSTSPFGPWSAPTTVTWNYSRPLDFHVWHFHMIRVDGVLHGIADHGGPEGLRACISTDGGATWTLNSDPMLVVPRPDQWDAVIYRACIAPHEDGVHFRVWYSAQTGPNWATGYTLIPRSYWPSPPT